MPPYEVDRHPALNDHCVPSKPQPSSCPCIILAAGSSKRLGFPKQLLRKDGETLLHRTTRLALEIGCSPVCVVLGSRADELRKALIGLPVHCIINEQWPSGMSSSLHAGIRSLRADHAAVPRILVLVCDQIALTREHLLNLLAAADNSPGKMIASAYHTKTGVPAVFPAPFHDALIQIEGDHGARDLLRTRADQVLSIPFPGGEQDIDTAADAYHARLRID